MLFYIYLYTTDLKQCIAFNILIQFTVWCRPTIHLNNTWWSFRTFYLTFMYYLCKCVTLMCFRPCWPIRSLKKFPVGGDNSAGSDITSQKLRFRCLHDNPNFRKSSPWQEFSKMLGFSDLVQSLREDEPHIKSCGFENNRWCGQGQWARALSIQITFKLERRRLPW